MPLEEQKKSRLYALKPLTDRLPAGSRPEGHVQFRTKMFWVLTPASGFVGSLNGSLFFDLIAGGHGVLLAKILIILRLFGGSYLVFLMDEVVSKWGIGSGISLFIAGGVAQQIFTGTFNWEPSRAGSLVPAGAIPKTIYYLQHLPASSLAQGGVEQIMVQPPNPLIALI